MKYAKLKGRMYEMELKQKEVAAMAGMTPMQLSGRMNGRIDFMLSEMYKLGEVLHIPDEELLTFFPRNRCVKKEKGNITHFLTQKKVAQA